MDTIDGLFETVRETASRATWSRGVELARGGSVLGDRVDGDAVILKVSPAGVIVARTVVLHPDDEDWSCDCGDTEDVCEHTTAAVIALRRARQAGKLLPELPAAIARVRYRFRRVDGALHFERAFLKEGREEPFDVNLSAISSGRVKGPIFVASSGDLLVDAALGTHVNGWLPREVMTKLVDLLADLSDLWLDDVPIRASKERTGLCVLLEDRGEGFLLSAAPDRSIDETFQNGLVRCGDLLKAVGESRLTARELEELRAGKVYRPEQLVDLVTSVLPRLREQIPVEIRTRRLPRASLARPRIQIEAGREGGALTVLPTLVYGDPAVARVDAGQLHLLSDELPTRDRPSEERLLRSLQMELGLIPGHRERFEGAQGIAFARKLERWRGEVVGEGTRDFFVVPPLTPHLAVSEESFEVSFESLDERTGTPVTRRAEPGAVLGAFRAGETLVPLLEGGFAPLPREWLEKHGHRLADLLAAREGRKVLPASALPDLARLCDALGEPRPPMLEALTPLIDTFDRLPVVPLPEAIEPLARDYQHRGIDWLSFLKKARLGALLADDMGLGKTLQALAAIEGPTLVVAPTSVVFNWAAEAARFRPDLVLSVYHGADRRLAPKADLVLTSYALLRLDIDRLSGRRWKTVVLDEAQTIKNPDSQVARAAYRLDAEWRVALTGTPIENRLDELWSQFHFLNPGMLGGRRDFDERYAKPLLSGEPGARDRLQERIRPFFLRRLKKDVATELPARSEITLRCQLSESELGLYQGLLAATREEVVAKLQGGGSVLQALELLLRLRQAACHPGLLPGQTAESSSKVDLLVEKLVEAAGDGHRALVFSQWTGLLDRIEPRLREAGLDFLRLDGSTRDRGEVVAKFQSSDGPPVMLISLKAGGAGLNLTAADHVFLVDPWWNPAVEDQAADRAHRIGQERPVFIHRMVAQGTIEERILLLQSAKRSIAEAALSGGEAAASLTRDDLLSLLA